MGSLTLQYPPMTGGSAEQQLDGLRRYLVQLTDELNGADWSAQAVFQQVGQMIDAEAMPEGEQKRSQLAGWASLKELIIKTADYTQKNSQGFEFQLSGNYLAVSDFGVFQEEMRLALEANESGITQTYDYFAEITSGLSDDITNLGTDVDGKLEQLGEDVDGKLAAQTQTLEDYKASISGELNTFTDEWGNKYSSLDEYTKGLSDSLNTTNDNVTSLGKDLDSTNEAVTGLGQSLDTTNDNVTALGGRTDALEDETAGVNNERGEGTDKDESGASITVRSKQYVKTGLLYYNLLTPRYGVAVGEIETDVEANGHPIDIRKNLLATFTSDRLSFWQEGQEVAYLTDKKMHFPNASLEAYDATLTGTITAAAGSSFGPWSVTESSIYRAEDKTENRLGGDGLYFGTSGLSIKDAFQVDADGKLTATGATVTGTIRANDLLLGTAKADGTTEYSSIKTQLRTLVDSVNELAVLAEAVSVNTEGESASASGFNFWADGIGGLQITKASTGSYAVELSSNAALRLKGGDGTVHIQNSNDTGAVSVTTDGVVSMKGTKFKWNGSEVTLGASTATAVFG